MDRAIVKIILSTRSTWSATTGTGRCYASSPISTTTPIETIAGRHCAGRSLAVVTTLNN